MKPSEVNDIVTIRNLKLPISSEMSSFDFESVLSFEDLRVEIHSGILIGEFAFYQSIAILLVLLMII